MELLVNIENMNNYLLPKISYYKNLGRQDNTFIPHRKLKENEIALYNKISMNFSYWKLLGNHQTKDAIILSRGSCPRYWKEIIKKI